MTQPFAPIARSTCIPLVLASLVMPEPIRIVLWVLAACILLQELVFMVFSLIAFVLVSCWELWSAPK